MLFKIVLLVAAAILIWVVDKFAPPKWALLLSAVPFFLLLWRMESDEEDEDPPDEAWETIGKYLFVLLCLWGVGFGVFAWSLRETSSIMGALWWPLLPGALVLLAYAIFRLFR